MVYFINLKVSSASMCTNNPVTFGCFQRVESRDQIKVDTTFERLISRPRFLYEKCLVFRALSNGTNFEVIWWVWFFTNRGARGTAGGGEKWHLGIDWNLSAFHFLYRYESSIQFKWKTWVDTNPLLSTTMCPTNMTGVIYASTWRFTS